MKELPFFIPKGAIQRVVKLSFSPSVVLGVKRINISQYYKKLFVVRGENNQVRLVLAGDLRGHECLLIKKYLMSKGRFQDH